MWITLKQTLAFAGVRHLDRPYQLPGSRVEMEGQFRP